VSSIEKAMEGQSGIAVRRDIGLARPADMQYESTSPKKEIGTFGDAPPTRNQKG